MQIQISEESRTILNTFVKNKKNGSKTCTTQYIRRKHTEPLYKLAEAKAYQKSESTPEKTTINSPRKEDLTSIEIKITEILDEYVRPAVESDGGAIHFHEFKDGVVSVVLKGACSGCPSSTMTLKTGIQNLLMDMLPEVKQVEAINGQLFIQFIVNLVQNLSK